MLDLFSDTARRRIVYAPLLLIIPLLGLGSRSGATWLPEFIADYAGDTLWATMLYLTIVFIAPRLTITAAAVLAMLGSIGVEVLQLYHAPWIDAVRSTRIGGLMLGYTFVWSDLLCYAIGVTIGVIIDQVVQRMVRERQPLN
jgi:hypothetical protein